MTIADFCKISQILEREATKSEYQSNDTIQLLNSSLQRLKTICSEMNSPEKMDIAYLFSHPELGQFLLTFLNQITKEYGEKLMLHHFYFLLVNNPDDKNLFIKSLLFIYFNNWFEFTLYNTSVSDHIDQLYQNNILPEIITVLSGYGAKIENIQEEPPDYFQPPYAEVKSLLILSIYIYQLSDDHLGENNAFSQNRVSFSYVKTDIEKLILHYEEFMQIFHILIISNQMGSEIKELKETINNKESNLDKVIRRKIKEAEAEIENLTSAHNRKTLESISIFVSVFAIIGVNFTLAAKEFRPYMLLYINSGLILTITVLFSLIDYRSKEDNSHWRKYILPIIVAIVLFMSGLVIQKTHWLTDFMLNLARRMIN